MQKTEKLSQDQQKLQKNQLIMLLSLVMVKHLLLHRILYIKSSNDRTCVIWRFNLEADKKI